ncbi:hypothetical protein [Vibrio campbellii]
MKKTLLVLSTAVLSAPSFAEGNPMESAIQSAIAAGQSNVGIVVAGLIGMAALAFGVNMVTGFLRK